MPRKYDGKHLILSQRVVIEKGLDSNESFCFDLLTRRLGIDAFWELFQVILTNNGTEFQNPVRLESTEDGKMCTKTYFCNPHSAWQKGKFIPAEIYTCICAT